MSDTPPAATGMAALGSTHSQPALFVTRAINRILRAQAPGRILTDDLVPTRERESALRRLGLVAEAELDHVTLQINVLMIDSGHTTLRMRTGLNGGVKTEMGGVSSHGARSARTMPTRHHYNHHRPHTWLGGPTLAERVRNITGRTISAFACACSSASRWGSV